MTDVEIIEGADKGRGTRGMAVWDNDCTGKAAERYPGLPCDQTQYVRTRINAPTEYLNPIQVK